MLDGKYKKMRREGTTPSDKQIDVYKRYKSKINELNKEIILVEKGN